MVDYSVKIKIGDKEGSGILYVPQNGEMVYIITVAHVLMEVKEKNELKVFYWGSNFKNLDKKERIYRYTEDDVENGTYRAVYLENYQKEIENSADDGAVIEISYESWMIRNNFQFDKAEESDLIVGYGYPCGANDNRITFRGTAERVVDEKIQIGENGDYIIAYNIGEYSPEAAVDKSYLDGFSGTGIFIEKGEECCLVGIFSRSMEEHPRVYCTDARKVYKLITELQLKNDENVLPASNVVVRRENDEIENIDIFKALDDFFNDSTAFIRCLHGYAGTGKTFAIEEIERKYNKGCNSKVKIETSWKKLIDCLNAKSINSLENTVYIFDCMEKVWDEKCRKQISFARGGKEKSNYRRLNAEEKACFFRKIWDKERELRANNIHILVVFRTNFLEDLKKYLFSNEGKSIWENIEKSFMDCVGYSNSQIHEAVGTECPSYLLEGDMIKRPLWMKYILESNLAEIKDEEQYTYEFHLIRDTLNWYIKCEGPNQDIEYFDDKEKQSLEVLKKQYINFILMYEGREHKGWDEQIHPLLWCYPFKSVNNTFEMDEKVLYAYFVATELYALLEDRNELDFKRSFLQAYHVASLDNTIGDRIIAYFRLLIQEEETGNAGTIFKTWILEDKYLECLKWYEADPTNDYIYIDRMHRKNDNKYLNQKQEVEKEEYLVDVQNTVDKMRAKIVNEEQEMEFHRTRRKKNE